MRIFRWIIAIPIAFTLSLAAWLILSSVFTRVHGSPNFAARLMGYSPLVIRTLVPTALYVITAATICRSEEEKTVLHFLCRRDTLVGKRGRITTQSDQMGILSFG